MVKTQKTQTIWTELNARQQVYLKLIYQVDQETEREEKRRGFTGERRPAEIWRWLFYGEVAVHKPSRLKHLLKIAHLVDPGTGSTLKALEQRKLIECRGKVPELKIKLTPRGRKVVRAGLGEIALKRPPKGMLSELGWKALVFVYCAGGAGLKQEWGFKYAEIHYNTWVKLQDYQGVPLVKEVYHPEDSSSRAMGANRLHITPFGLDFYQLHWERYQSLYPDIEAPEPSEASPDLAAQQPVDIAMLVRLKRGSRGLRETADDIGYGISPSTLSRVEQGKKIDQPLLELICDWLQVSLPVRS